MGVVEIYKISCEGCGKWLADVTGGRVTMHKRTAQTFPSKTAAEGMRARAFTNGRCPKCSGGGR